MVKRKRLFQINLSTNTGSYAAITRGSCIAFAILVIGIGIIDYRQLQGLKEQAMSLEQSILRVRNLNQQMLRHDGISDTVVKTIPRDITAMNQLIMKSAFSWSQFLTDLETVVPNGVSIQSLRLDTKDSAISISALALSLRELTQFIIVLNEHRAFKNINLLQHRRHEDSTVEFAMALKYQSGEDK